MATPSQPTEAETPNTTIQPPRPVWVRIALWGSPTRRRAMSFMYVSLVLTGVFVALSLWDRRPTAGVALILATLWYWGAIRWVDLHGEWRPSTRASIRSKAAMILTSLAVAVFLALVGTKAFFIDYYRLPQNGMYPGLPAGSAFFTAKRPYADASSVKRGDIVVFVREENRQRYNYIWRVVALPGETVVASGESLAINGHAVQRHHLREADGKIVFREQIGDISYEVAFDKQPVFQPPDVSVTVPTGHFFVMGDNRFRAQDSRYFGPIAFSSIIGKRL